MRIKELLRERNLTSKDLAKKLGLSEGALSQSINGNPTLERLKQIAEALGVDVRDLFDGAPLVESVNCPKCGAVIRLEITHVKINPVEMRNDEDS